MGAELHFTLHRQWAAKSHSARYLRGRKHRARNCRNCRVCKNFVTRPRITWLMAAPVMILGDGFAACCCAHLLARSGTPVALDRGPRRKLPVILISEAIQNLMTDVFEEPDLFAGCHPIRKRIVRWGQSRQPLTLPHSGVVVDEQAMLERLWNREAP